jgi:flavin-dependent dehydrogenase
VSTPVQSVVIVGGGTAGWLTAGTLAATYGVDSERPVSITLIESPNVPTIGVGEGTWPTMRDTLRRMGLSETEFMRRCDAAFKQGARFAKWVSGEDDDYYYHPLMLPQGFLQGNLVPHWQRDHRDKAFSAAVCPQDHICDRNLAPKQITTPEFAGILNYAYHLDAGKFSEFVCEHCIAKLGVRHVLDDVTGVNTKDNNDIASVATKEHDDIDGDLFVDCTGFRGILIGEHYGIDYESCRKQLFIDRALAVQVPYASPDDSIASQTISTGQSAGWIWDIGLSSRRGVGHVYASDYNDEETALAELQAYVAPTGHNIQDLGVRKIRFDPGHRKQFWKNNCVAVGLSAGFLEPLEASALVLIELSGRMITEQLPATREAMDIVARRFNDKFLYRWDRIIDFLKLHYILNRRTEPFWVDNRDPDTIPDSLKELMQLWRFQPPFHDDFDHKDEVFPSASYQYVLYGMGFDTEPSHFGASASARQFAEEQFRENERISNELISRMPDNRTLLKKIHKHGMQRI